jgi:hypothetical protein
MTPLRQRMIEVFFCACVMAVMHFIAAGWQVD